MFTSMGLGLMRFFLTWCLGLQIQSEFSGFKAIGGLRIQGVKLRAGGFELTKYIGFTGSLFRVYRVWVL